MCVRKRLTLRYQSGCCLGYLEPSIWTNLPTTLESSLVKQRDIKAPDMCQIDQRLILTDPADSEFQGETKANNQLPTATKAANKSYTEL